MNVLWYSCVLDGTLKQHHNASCADACEVKTHNIELSAAQISRLSVEELLSLHLDEVTINNRNATEMRTRVVDKQMKQVLQAFEDAKRSRQRFQSFLEINVIDIGTSIVHHVQNAISEMDSLVNTSIYGQLFQNIQNYTNEYQARMNPPVTILNNALLKSYRAFTVFNHMVMDFNYQRNPNMRDLEVYNMLTAAGKNAIQLFEADASLLQFYLWRNVSNRDNLPDYDVGNAVARKECNRTKTTLTEIDSYINLIQEVIQQIEDKHNDNEGYQYSLGAGEGDCLGDTASASTSTTPSYTSTTSDWSDSYSSSSSTTSSYDIPTYTPPPYIDKVCRTHWVSHENAQWLQTNTSMIKSHIEKVISCKSQYSDFLTSLNAWLNNLNIYGTHNFANKYDFVKLMDELRQDATWIEENMELFKSHKEFLAKTASNILSHRSDQFVMTTEDAYSDILQLIIAPILVCAI